ncbi:MAG: chorismate mutase [Actinomycetia bacterium]|nr:chorismate mutase [Actinomycetes bacterium]
MFALLICTAAAGVAVGTGLAVAPSAFAQPESPLVALVDAAAQRLQVAEPVAAFKFQTGGLIEDPDREQEVLQAAARDAASRHIDPSYVTVVFRDQIDATVAIEYTRLAQWKFDPALAPSIAPDLSSSRVAIDELNRVMVSEMADAWDALHSPTCAADLEAAKVVAVQAHAMDPLYQQALDLATGNYCR